MKHLLGRRVVALGAILLLTACGGGLSTPGGEQSFVAGNGTVSFIAQGKRAQAPPIAGTDLHGKLFRQAVGGILVINVWASWCAPCRAEAPTLEQLSKTYAASGVQFVGLLTRDNDDAARAFERRFGITYPTIRGDKIIASFSSSLSPNAIPTTLVIDRKNRVAARLSGQVTVSSLSEMINRVIAEGA
jgi:thiol-disulfide isomerase/thioredoxin